MKKFDKTLLAIILVGLILRVISINQSLWLDEATSAKVATYSMDQILEFSFGDFHPPLYYIFLKYWSGVFGFSEIALRSMSLVFGLLTIYFVYRIGKLVDKQALGALASLFLAISPLHVYYSQEARMYAMATFFVTLAFWAFLTTLKQKKSFLSWIIFAFVMVLAIWTEYLTFFMLPVFWLMAFGFKKNNFWMKRFLVMNFVILFSFLLIFPIFIRQLSAGLTVRLGASGWWNILGSASVKNLILVPVKFNIGRIGFENKVVYSLVVLLSVGLGAFLFMKSLLMGEKAKQFYFWLFIPILLLFLVSFFIPVFSYFRLIFLLPAFYFVYASGFLRLLNKHFFPLLIVFLLSQFLFVGLYLSDKRYHREDWRRLVQTINETSQERNSKILFVSDSQFEALEYYKPVLAFGDLSILDEETEEVWLMRYVWDVFNPSDSVRGEIENRGYVKQEEYDFNGVVVWRYENSN